MRQTGDNSLGPFPPGLKNPIMGPDFSNATDYLNPALLGLNFLLFYNNNQRYLALGTEWTTISGGGIRILLSGFNAAIAQKKKTKGNTKEREERGGGG